MRWLASILLVLSVLRVHAAVVVVNDALPLQSISVERVRDMLLGRVSTWESGVSVTIVLCTDESGEAAVAELCGRSVGLLQRGWKRLVFSGTGAMPLVVTSRQAVFEAVARFPGAIAVLTQAESGPRCRVVPVGDIRAALPIKQ